MSKEASRRYRLKHPAKVKALIQAWRNANPEKVKEHARRERAKNSEKYSARLKKWIALNRPRYDEAKVAWRRDHPEIGRRYRKKYPEKQNAAAAKRRAILLRAMPRWLTREQYQSIKSIYKEAQQITRETGVPHSVDHIVPLRGIFVSGLHVPWNLAVIPSAENVKKNRHYDDANAMPAAICSPV